MKFRKLSDEIEATRWFKNGDHPEDDYPEAGGEGCVVRYFRLPGLDGQHPCLVCRVRYSKHGFIDTPHGGHRVCPGDWIVTSAGGDFFPFKDDDFRAAYEPVDAVWPGD